MQKVKFISSEDNEYSIGHPKMSEFEKAVNDFISKHNVIDIRYQSSVAYAANEMMGDTATLHSVMITYDE